MSPSSSSEPQTVAPALARPSLVAPALMLAGIGVGTGLMYALNRIATTSGIPFIPYSFWTVVLSAIVLFVASVIARVPPRLSGQHVQSYATIGLLNMALPLSVLTFVAPKVPAAILSLGQPLLPMITYALALGVAIERLRLMRLGGLVLGLVGVLLIVAPDSSMPEPGMAGWVLIALTAQLSIAVGAIAATKYAPPNASSLTMAAGVQTCAALFLLPAMAVDGSWWAFDSGIGNGELALLAVAAFFVFFWICFFEIIRRAGPVFFSTVNYIATLAGVVWGILIFGDVLSSWLWAALAVMLAGLYLMNRRLD